MGLLLSPTKVQALKMSTLQTVAASQSCLLLEPRPFMIALRKPRCREEEGEEEGRGARRRGGREGKGKRGEEEEERRETFTCCHHLIDLIQPIVTA